MADDNNVPVVTFTNRLTLEQIKRLMHSPTSTNNEPYYKSVEEIQQSAERIAKETQDAFREMVRGLVNDRK